MDDPKDEKSRKVFIERLTLGVTRVLGKSPLEILSFVVTLASPGMQPMDATSKQCINQASDKL